MIERTSTPTRGAAARVVQCSEIEGSFGYIYVIGNVQPKFPSQDVEKEYLQLAAAEDIKGTTFEQRLYEVLSKKENLYFARAMAWVFLIEDVASYALHPRSDVELEQLIDSMKPDADPTEAEYDVIIGVHEPLPGAAVEDLPWVTVNRLFHFQAKEFIKKVPVPSSVKSSPAALAQFQKLVYAIFNDMLQLADNTGDADEHRALNYVSLSYPDIYALAWLLPAPVSGGTWAFTGVDVEVSRLSGARHIVEVIFKYTDQTAGVTSRYFTSVDVTGQFPFLVTKLQPYFER